MRIRMSEAINMAIADEMDADSSVVLWGEDVAAAGGIFKVTSDLQARFGSLRVRDTPISEMGFLGAAVGAATMGLRPVVEIMFVEFLGVALDQLVTQAGLMRYLSKGEYSAPLVVRASVGAGLGFGAQHSQTLERWVIGSQGVRVLMVSDPQSAYGLTRAAIRSDDPVLILEPRALYATRGAITRGEEGVGLLGEARMMRKGSKVTVLAAGSTVGSVLEAVDGHHIDADVIDLQTLWPLDKATIFGSVLGTGRVAIVEEGCRSGGWGDLISAAIAEEIGGHLQAPVLRISAPDVPVPFASSLERRFTPDATEIARRLIPLAAGETPPAPWWHDRSSSSDSRQSR